MAATTVLLSVLQIIADVKTNQQDCVRLAQRAARLLMDLDDAWRESGKTRRSRCWRTSVSWRRECRAHTTLLSIRDFMLKAAQTNGSADWLQRQHTGSVDAVDRFDQQLKDATMSFQVSSLIEIHYAIGASSRNTPRITDGQTFTSPTQSSEALASLGDGTTLECSASSFELVQKSCDSTESLLSSFTLVEPDSMVLEPGPELPPDATPVPTEEEEFLANMSGDADEFGFRRYHRSDVIVRKANRRARYDGTKDLALKQWVKDIKMLRNLHHENLPQILGYSDGIAQTPFILLESVQCRDLASTMQSALTTRSLANCASLILKTYRDVASAIAHAQQQLSLSESDDQDFIDHATYSIDSDNNVIVGLPPPREGWVTARSYCLEESLSDRALHNLKELMNVEEAALQAGSCQTSTSLNKYKQLKSLLQCLLPRQREGLGLAPELEDLLDDADEDNPLTLRALRAHCVKKSRHDQTWHARAPVGTLTAGIMGTSQKARQILQILYHPGRPGRRQKGKGDDGSRWQDTWHDAPAVQ
ncbi:hypothetical protein BGY98DRAFT_1099197 [Russula aff. rugulosa BPL654]|nr:hypothetical protein BGY98DRAFT_1099197 [Russula aff. rugulosa BPL654]